MPDQTKVISYTDLTEYDGLLKSWVGDEIEATAGDLATLETTAKTDLVAAINEVVGDVDDIETNSAVTVTSAAGTGSILTAYTIAQGGTTVGTINIPKDLVVTSGEIVVFDEGDTLPEGVTQPGTYLKLVIANQTNPVYIDVASMIDNYTAASSATQVQVAIDASTRVISASLVAGGVTATELATDAVTTAKIADSNVTAGKLATDSVTTVKIADGNVTTAKLDASAVTTAKIADANVTSDKLASDAVTTAKIVDANVTKAKLAQAVQDQLDKYTDCEAGDIAALFPSSSNSEQSGN